MPESVIAWTKLVSRQVKGGQGREALRLYCKMREEGVIPDHYAFLAALNACISASELEEGRRIHSHLNDSGHSNMLMENKLLHMYTKCGSMEDALLVFETMRYRNVVSWNAVIMGYASMQMGGSALELYRHMKNEGFVPSDRTFVAALKACASLGSQGGQASNHKLLKANYLGQGRSIHAEAAKGGHDTDVFVATTLVDMYLKCGSVEEASKVFERMTHRTVVSWTAMIAGYVQMQMSTLALDLFTRMQNEGFSPGHCTFVAALKACACLAAQEEGKGADGKLQKTSCLQQGKAIHAEVARRGFESEILIANSLVNMYAKCGSIDDAFRVFERMTCRDVASWNAMITGYAQAEMGDRALGLYAHMQREGFTPNARTFVAALKACSCLSEQGECERVMLMACTSVAAQEEGKRADGTFLKPSFLEQGKAIHAEVAKRGLESDVFVASSLVDMYAKHGSMKDARRVFENMKQRDVVSWNALIMGYAQSDMGAAALGLYVRMQDEGFQPSGRTFVAALKACANMAAQRCGNEPNGQLLKPSYLEQGRIIHAEVVKRGLESDIFVANTLLDMYAKCGCMEEVFQVFDKMRHRDVVSWNAMIAGSGQMGMGNLALKLYAHMQHEGFIPDAHTFIAALKACSSLAEQEQSKGICSKLLHICYLEQGRGIHAEAVKGGFESVLFIANTLIDMYAKCRSIGDARQVFETMKHRDVVSWNVMIGGYAQMDMGSLALELYACMQHEGFMPNAYTFVAALKACASLAIQEEGKGTDSEGLKISCLEQGRAIHAQVTKGGLESDIFIANTLVDMYAKCRSMDDAHKVFKRMRQWTVVSWNAMIVGYIRMGMGASGLEFYARMQQYGFSPDAGTFIAALMACASLAACEEGKGADGKRLKAIHLEQGRGIHAEVAKRGFESDLFVASTLVDMYAKCGSIEDACQVFEKMVHRNAVSWNSMIMGYAQMEMGDSAMDLFARMQYEGFLPDAHTFVAALQACVSLASLISGKILHSQILRAGLEGQSYIASCLIGMYSKCGSMGDAQQYFNSLLVRNSITWNALIAGYSGQGDSECVFDLYKRMQQEGVKPDGNTFISVLNVCSHIGLIHEGQLYFQAMCKDHGIFPSRNHYTCTTDLLARAGGLDEAAAMVMKMPFEPLIVTWMSILSACRKWNNVETGRNTFECTVMLDEKFSAAHALMAKIYCSSGMWEESARLEELMIKAQSWKIPGECRWIDSSAMGG